MSQSDNPCGQLVCEQFPELERLNYCHGQMLSAQDFVDEQAYFLNKIALLTRCLQGYGVVCGLIACIDEKTEWLTVSCGIAVDPRGRELVLRTEYPSTQEGKMTVEEQVKSLLSDSDRVKYSDRKEGELIELYLTVEYHSELAGSQLLPNGGCCGDAERRIQNRWAEKPCLRLSFSPPPDQSCCSCCDTISDAQILLAKVTCSNGIWKVDNSIRRLITTYETTKIASINWFHSGVYRESLAEWLMDRGLELHFSAPIQANSILAHKTILNVNTGRKDKEWEDQETNDIVEVAVSDEISVPSNNHLQILQCEIELLGENVICVDKKDILTATGIKVRAKSANLGAPKRILVTVRTEFILDLCGKPIDGTHVAAATGYAGEGPNTKNVDKKNANKPNEEPQATFESRVNGLADNYQASRSSYDAKKMGLLLHPKRNSLRHESGNGVVGSTFQSWFYSVEDNCESNQA